MTVAATDLMAPERPRFLQAGGEMRHSSPDDGAAALRLAIIGERDRHELLAHLLRLSEADRRMRFMQIMSNDALESHVAGIDLALNLRLALFDPNGSLVALAEGFSYVAGARREMEVAFSTDASWRRRGLAKRLWTAMVERARDHGVERMVLHCDSRNTGMRGLLSAVGATSSVEATEVHATCAVAA